MGAIGDIVEHGASGQVARLGDWCVLHAGREYPAVDLIRQAARRSTGRDLLSADLGPDKDEACYALLDQLGFELVPTGDHQKTQQNQEDLAQAEILQNPDIEPTTREQLIQARTGQGRFRRNVALIEMQGCRISGVRNLAHLRASHIKPWKDASDAERLDGYNGLLMAPHIDHLFDHGYISFDDDGRLLISKSLDSAVLDAWSVNRQQNVGPFLPKQCEYLAYHRNHVFDKA